MSEIVGTLVHKRAHEIRTHKIGGCKLEFSTFPYYYTTKWGELSCIHCMKESVVLWRGKFLFKSYVPFHKGIAIVFRIILIEFFVALYFNHFFLTI